jgi:hypothetical protein
LPAAESEGQLQVLSFNGKGVPMIKREAGKLKARLGKGEKRQKKEEALVGVIYSVLSCDRILRYRNAQPQPAPKQIQARP